jgi:hypothetical protein
LDSRTIGAALAAVVSLAACDVADPREILTPGEIVVDYDPASDTRLHVPDSSEAGGALAVSLWTAGNACVRMGRTDVGVSGDTVTIEPLDWVRTGTGVACADVLLLIDHSVDLQLPPADSAWVVIRGREFASGDPVEIEQVVVVR